MKPEDTQNKNKQRAGSSLIDVVIAIAIIALLFSAIYAVYFSLIDSITSIESRTAASQALAATLEVIRGLPYDQVGTVGGIPAGVIPQNQTSTIGNFLFNIKTTIRNIDDPFDGSIGGTPNDTAPADYKQVTMEVSCLTCTKFAPFQFTTTVAPKNLENTAITGSLFVNVFDAAGVGVGGATVHVVNASVTPAIDLTDTTNASGSLQLVGVATSTQKYQITVSKNGYSSEKTYTLGDAGNPNPVKPHATIASQSVTSISFAIDRVSTLALSATDNLCVPIANQSIALAGAKIIGTSPDVLKFSTTTATDASGVATMQNLEWDTYAIAVSSSTYDLSGMSLPTPLTINPSTTNSLGITLQVPARPTVQVFATDTDTGAPVAGATVTLSKSGFSQTSVTGHSTTGHTSWTGGSYISQSGTVDAQNTPGALTIQATGGVYPTSTIAWLISNTIDTASASSSFYTLLWTGSQPAQTAVQFQVAANNDNATWNFTGPTGASSYYTAASSTISGLDGNRYIRYKVFLTTNNENVTPQVDSVTFEFSGVCVPSGAAVFNSLPTGTYTVTTAATGYTTATSSISVSSNSWQQVNVSLSH